MIPIFGKPLFTSPSIRVFVKFYILAVTKEIKEVKELVSYIGASRSRRSP